MKYFTDNFERRGTCYHEFTRGKWDGSTFWNDNSLYLRDDILSDMRLYELVLKPAFEVQGLKFNRWGANVVTRELWNDILSKAHDAGDEVGELFSEIETFVEKGLSEDGEFSILGV